VDDRRAPQRRLALQLLVALEEQLGSAGAPRLGLTGAPGAGKSTLLDVLIRRLRQRGETVGVLAVDPSSHRTGGALLGDRIRLRGRPGDAGLFIRSLAARDQLGGLAESTRASALVLAAAFDLVWIETVGVGQSEGEVADLVDSLVLVAQPGSGDLLQFMKAGVLELPDVIAMNKADLGPSAERSARELEAGLRLGERREDWTPPVVLLSARDGSGIDELEAALQRHRCWLAEGERLARRRRQSRDAAVLGQLQRRYGSHGIERLGGLQAVEARLREQPDASGFALAEQLGHEIEAMLAKPRGGP